MRQLVGDDELKLLFGGREAEEPARHIEEAAHVGEGVDLAGFKHGDRRPKILALAKVDDGMGRLDDRAFL